MTKHEFLSELRACLAGLPEEDVLRSIEFYTEALDDRIEEGMSEESAVADLGAPKELAARILAEIPLTRLVKNKLKPRRKMSSLTVVLLIIGSPIWASLAIAALAVLFTVFAVLWAVGTAVLYSSTLALAVGGLGGGICYLISYAMVGNIAGGIALLGAGILCAGLSILLLLVSNRYLRFLLWFSRKSFLWIKSLFVRKEADA